MKGDTEGKSALRKLVVISFLTLDGVMQAPGGEDEDGEGGFRHGGWQRPFFGDGDGVIPETISKAGALLLGRKTYDIFAGYWPTVGREVEWFGGFMNQVTKYVASTTLQQAEWENSMLLEGDAAEAVARIKREPGGDIFVFGSGDFCQTLMREHLVDEYLLMIHPLTLGSGKRLFREGGPTRDLELVKSTTTRKGVLLLSYRVKG